MPIYLKQSTASQEIPLGYFLDSTDGDTAEDGLTIANTDIKIWKTGATTLADKNSGGATHIAGGIYYAVLDATDTNTLGPLIIFCHPTGALAVRVECVVLAANVYDSLIGATDRLQTDVREFGDVNLALTTQMKTDVNTQVVDTLVTDTYAEVAAVPAATSSLKDKINWLFALARNKVTSSGTAITLRDDADTVDVATSNHNDSGTVYTRGKWT